MKKVMIKMTATVVALFVSVLLLPIWPVVFAVMVWNDADDDEKEGK